MKVSYLNKKYRYKCGKIKNKLFEEYLLFFKYISYQYVFNLFSSFARFNKYLCFCLPSDSAIFSRNRMENSMIRGHGVFSQRSRRMFYETSFGSTFRRRTQELNSTGVFEMGSIETTKPTGVTLVSNLKYKHDADINVNCSASRSTITDNNGLKFHQDSCIYGNT